MADDNKSQTKEDDNKSNEEADNKAEDTKAEETAAEFLPSEETEEESKAEDPELKKWVEETGSLENAYKRVQASEREAKRVKEEYERAQEEVQQVQDMQQRIEEGLQALAARNPQLVQQLNQEVDALKGVNPAQQFAQPQVTQNPEQPTQPQDEASQAVLEWKKQQEEQNQLRIKKFHDSHREHIKDNDEWLSILDYAKGLSGKTDRKGEKFTVESALQTAFGYYHPEIELEQTKLETQAELERRGSASEPGDVPSGGSDSKSDKPLTEQEEYVAKQLGLSAEEYQASKSELPR